MAKIDIKLIQELRERTAAGMMDCKKALQESDGDIEKAIEILRKKGAATAAKRAGKATAEGIVHAYIHPGSRIGVLIELNCETDFVARTDEMKNLAQDLCMQIVALNPLYLKPEDVDEKFIEHERSKFKQDLIDSGKPDKIIDNSRPSRGAAFHREKADPIAPGGPGNLRKLGLTFNTTSATKRESGESPAA